MNTCELDEIGQNVLILEEVLFFELFTTENQKNKQLIQFILCQLDVGGWRNSTVFMNDAV